MKFFFVLLLLISSIASGQNNNFENDPASWVNPLIGTESSFKLSNGNTYPAIALPWGMNFWTPYTGKMGDGWQYTYEAFKIMGFKETHEPSPWINDYGAFAIMPVTGKLKYDQDGRASWFSHKRETVKPYYYKVFLGDYNTWVETAPTDRAAIFRIKYPGNVSSYLVLDAFFKGSYVKIIPGKREIIGYCRNNSGGVPSNFHNYFILKFNTDFDSTYTWDTSGISGNSLEKKGEHVGAVIKFRGQNKKTIEVKAASSFISLEQAELNLDREIGGKSFDEIEAQAHETWNKYLGRIEIEGASNEQKTTFYTAFYRTLLFPRKFYEYNENNKVVHYSPYNGKVVPGYMFTDDGFWDTFRAVFPFITLMFPDVDSHIMAGLVNAYNESGWLPEWASPGHRDCMIGSNSASIIADSYLSGVRGYDINTLYKALIKNSDREGPLSSVGRKGVHYYNSLGYIPYNAGINENVARTLEYSYDDFALMKLSQKLGKSDYLIKLFANRAFNYRNVFDKSINFMRGKNINGTWQFPFRPDKWGDAFTEGCSWHWTWSVFHDPQGLINLMGGRKAFTEKLDSLFIAPPTFDDSYYGYQIHEITEMVIAGMGQYAHGNEPVHHVLYLYDYSGYPWKAQKHLRKVMDLLYTSRPDGLCGDEDNGQMSAWYLFSSMGFYPVCPVSLQYAIGSPLFKKVTIKLENGNQFVIGAANNNKKNIYIDTAELNGNEYSKNYISLNDILKGGELNFKMSSKPNKYRGKSKEDFPYSFSVDRK